MIILDVNRDLCNATSPCVYTVENNTVLLSLMTSQLLTNKCDGGHMCPPPRECCQQGCCFQQPGNVFTPLFLGHWYFWLAVTATVAGILCACSLWKRHSQGHLCCGDGGRDERASEPDSNGSCYAPPQYSRCNSFHQAPPPYSEVTSKPDLYPLVISYNAEPITKNNSSTGYLMVQYFRNFIVRPAGTISATSTIDSLSSSFICNAVNEANTIIPPPYSSMGSLEEEDPDDDNLTDSARNLPLSASFTSYSGEFQQQHKNNVQNTNCTNSPGGESKISIPPHITPVHSPCLIRPQSVVSIRNNPCFGQNTTKLIFNSTVPNELNQPNKNDKAETKTQSICDANFNKKLKIHKLLKERSLDSEMQDDDNCFSDLLNLSVCAPSSVAQVEMSVHSSSPQIINELQYSVTNSMTGSDISSLANLGTPDSPPRATSPTMEMKEILDRIQQLPHQRSPTPQQQSSDGATAAAAVASVRSNKTYFHKVKAKTLYMPLYDSTPPKTKNNIPNVFSRGWLSRSAPNTPCGNFIPNFPVNKSNSKSSKIKITDGSPLLTEHEESEEDNSRDECL